ncbi:MAG: ankyrin repeat domain-containing protein [Spirochaetaceae bacterium]|jgi:ankyrin repeat protein|nr:ankyrin repeat domain-containing protein [Spirochaetaceae bacterium]GMO21325.1 MAG: ankyrin repeat domain-containing protein [Termitinemataceae bacterium]
MKTRRLQQIIRGFIVTVFFTASLFFVYSNRVLLAEEPAGIIAQAKAKAKQPTKRSLKSAKTVPERLGVLIETGKQEEAKTLFVNSMNPGDVSPDGKNALHYAAAAKNTELADFFVKLGASVMTADNEHNTPLNISASLGDSKTAAVFVNNGAYIHNRNNAGETPALLAINPQNSGLLTAILTSTSLVSVDEDGKTILHLAIEKENQTAVETIIRAARDARGAVLQNLLGIRDKAGQNPLDDCFSNRTSNTAASISVSLINAGGSSSDGFFAIFAPAVRILNYNLRSSAGLPPLNYAVRERYTGWTNYLLEKRADPNIKSTAGDTPLIEAARTGDIEAMRVLLRFGAQVNTQDAQGNTAMHVAIPPEAHRNALSLLLENNGNPNIRDMRGDSPLHIVVDLDRPPDVLEVLLAARADVSIHNIDGKTPLFIAVEKNRSALIPLLLSYRSDIFAADNAGVTPFEQALKTNSPALDQLITPETVMQSDNGGNTILISAVRLRASADVDRRILDRQSAVNIVNARNQEGDTALHIAVRQNDSAAGELFISRGADIFLQNAKGESPLSLTFYTKGGVREWMFVPAVLNAKDGQGRTILHLAAEWKLDQSIPVIVSKGAVVDAQNSLGETPLFIAVRFDSASTIRALLQAGANLNGRDSLGNTALHAAVRYEALSAAEALINARIDINAYNLGGNTPLHDAVRLGKFSLANLFVQRGANLELRDSNGNTPLALAILEGNLRMAEYLVRNGADVQTRNSSGSTPLLTAVQDERSDLVALLIENGAQIHAQNAAGVSPFMAALNVSPRIVLSLLSKGRDQTDNEGRSPLHIAIAAKKSEQEIEAIAGWVGTKQLSVVDREGQTPLRYAVNNGNWEAAKFLTDQGSNVFSVAMDGRTPADVAFSYGNKDAVRALFGGKSVSATDQSGNTPLHYAARQGSADIISFLLDLGAQRSAHNTAGETPADIAIRWGNTEAANLLR